MKDECYVSLKIFYLWRVHRFNSNTVKTVLHNIYSVMCTLDSPEARKVVLSARTKLKDSKIYKKVHVYTKVQSVEERSLNNNIKILWMYFVQICDISMKGNRVVQVDLEERNHFMSRFWISEEMNLMIVKVNSLESMVATSFMEINVGIRVTLMLLEPKVHIMTLVVVFQGTEVIHIEIVIDKRETTPVLLSQGSGSW